MRLMRPVTWSPLRLRFVIEMASMDAWRSMNVQAIRDPAYQQLLVEIAPMMDGSKTADEVWA
jgi:hypothetical protein